MINGNKVTLIPATLDDRRNVYEWCFHSEVTKWHAGPPHFPNVDIPTYEEFCEDYMDYFFTDEEPEKGRGFIITHDDEPVGFISYTAYHLKPRKSELDIWMNREAFCGKGFGTDAITSLMKFMGSTMGIREFIMRPSVKNSRAISSYNKAGFEESDAVPEDYLLAEYVQVYGDGDYGEGESVLLVRQEGELAQ
ncbi:MAG: GNAT family N-acetyltransferase [Defluviitaleaceae bacterium]|nr:GNAT family N-acetyltransferase [Defluviitaleaceae bacterium]